MAWCASRCGPLVAAAVVAVVVLVVPSTAVTVVLDLLTVGVLVAVLALRARVPSREIRRWLAVAAVGVGLLVVGNAVWDVAVHLWGIDPAGGAADLLFALGYVGIGVGLVGLMVDLVGDGWVDLIAEIVVVAAVTGTAMWLFVMSPGSSAGGPPLEHLAALTLIGASAVRVGLGLRLAVTVPRARGLTRLATGWVVWFVGDVTYALMPDFSQFKAGVPADAMFGAAMVLVIAGLQHPTLVGDVWGRARVTRRRDLRAHLWMIVGVVVLPPVAVLASGVLDGTDRVVVAGAVALVAVATVVRAERARTLQQRAQHEREAALRDTLTRERAVDEELRRVGQMRDLFLRAISHQLRTPLTAIMGFATTLDRQGDALEPEVAARLRARILGNARRLEVLTDALVDFDLLSRGQMEQRIEQIDVAAMVARALPGVPIQDRTVALAVDGVQVTGDPALLVRAIGRLLTNAVRHTPPGTTITVGAVRVMGHVQLTVADDGPGIPPGLHERIFEPLVTGPAAADDPDPGVGLGLALVDHIVRLHGGQAWVEDNDRGGASFQLLLPEAEAADSDAVASPLAWWRERDRAAARGADEERRAASMPG